MPGVLVGARRSATSWRAEIREIAHLSPAPKTDTRPKLTSAERREAAAARRITRVPQDTAPVSPNAGSAAVARAVDLNGRHRMVPHISVVGTAATSNAR